jgi:rhamnulokinase
MTADATGKTVVVGPYEATAAGNVLVQAMGDGMIAGSADIRRIVRQSFDLKVYQPAQTEQWHEPYRRYVKMVNESHR